jgi:aspartate/methionine/tyrosine aminotransferase
MAERTITVNGFSKAYAMDGWRLGYLAAPREMVKTMVRVRQYLTTTPTSFAQAGAVAAYNGPQERVEAMRQEYDRRRRFLVAALNDIPGLQCVWPRGAFYAFPSVVGLGLSSAEAATYFLEEANVAVVAGTAFGHSGEGFVRLSYATAYDDIVLATERLREAARRRLG